MVRRQCRRHPPARCNVGAAQQVALPLIHLLANRDCLVLLGPAGLRMVRAQQSEDANGSSSGHNGGPAGGTSGGSGADAGSSGTGTGSVVGSSTISLLQVAALLGDMGERMLPAAAACPRQPPASQCNPLQIQPTSCAGCSRTCNSSPQLHCPACRAPDNP